MRWIAILACFFVLTGAALAAGSDEQYLDVYNEILEGDTLMQGGHADAAAIRYLQAQSDLLKLQSEHPFWNPDIVKFRLGYLADQLKALGKSVATNAPPAITQTAPQPAVAPPVSIGPTVADLEHQNAGLQDQIRSLTDANTELRAKLKEALSVQPAAVSPDELAKAQARIVMLQKERDLLAVALDQEKAAHANSIPATKVEELVGQLAALRASADADAKKSREELAQLREVLAQAEEKLARANSDLDALKAAHPPEAQIAPAPQQIPEAADQLKQQLAEISKDEAEISGLKDEVTAADQKLAAANTELDSLKAAKPATSEPADDAKAVSEERDKLKEELAERSKDLADAEAHNNQELLTLRASLQQAEQQREDLEKKLAAAPPETSLSARQVEQLQARVAVLEADPVPYTAEEIAAMNKSPAPAPEAAPAPATSAAPSNPTPMAPPATTAAAAAPAPSTNATSIPHIYTTQDLPAGVGALWADALRASMDHDYDTAEQKFKDVLRQDATNVFVLDHLAEAQFAANHLDACEKTVQQAIAMDPNDPASLYLMGLLRYRQNRLDEALDALSLSAKLNPTNSATENFLGCVLAEKGLRPAAETALRRSLECDPDNADAHFNLAVVYSGNHPPSLELARWHYKKALALGHHPSATLDKLLENPQP